jgi:hypothetical protein
MGLVHVDTRTSEGLAGRSTEKFLVIKIDSVVIHINTFSAASGSDMDAVNLEG